MGVVYRAHDASLNRDVAVKLLQSHYAPTGFAARRFLDEARITGQLQHPGIPPVHQVGTAPDGRPFIAMKLIKGDTLADLLAAGRLNRGEQLAVFEQVCQAVAYAHSRGVIHRDLKPQNVMVGAFAEVQVMDWGLAKFRAAARLETLEASTASTFYDPRDEDESLRTRAGEFLGTPAFMPPEQAIGAIDEIDERSDVFGLGAVLCNLLTGAPPFVADNAESTRQLAAQGKLAPAFARLDSCTAEPELIALCKRCLAAEKADRPADAGAVAKAVAAVRADAEQRARKAELDKAAAEVQVVEQRRRRRWQLALACSVFVILLGGGAFAWWENENIAQRQRREEQNRLERNAEALAALIRGCEAALEEGDVVRAADAIPEIDRRLSEGNDKGLRKRAERCRADLVILRELEAIDTFRLTKRKHELPDDLRVAARWRETLATSGIIPDSIPPAEIAERLATSLIRDRLLTTLDLWLCFEPSIELREVLRVADPDPYRDAVRDAVEARDRQRQEKLGIQPDVLSQPFRFSAVLGQLNPISEKRLRIVLMAALRSRPGDLTLLTAIDRACLKLPDLSKGEERRVNWERLRWAQAAVAAHPRNAGVRHRLGWALYQIDDFDGAIAEYQETLRLDPGYAAAHAGIADALKESGDINGAIASYREAVRLDPEDAWTHRSLGETLMKQGNLNGAITSYRQVVRLEPTNAGNHQFLGDVLKKRGDLDGAISCFRASVRLEPKNVSSHRSLGETLRKNGNLDGAIASYREATRLDSRNSLLRTELLEAIEAKASPSGIIDFWKEAVGLDPKDALAYRSLGDALEAKGDLVGAVASYREAYRLNPEDSMSHELLVEMLRQKGDLDQSKGNIDAGIASYREAIILKPKALRERRKLALLLAQRGDRAEAMAVVHEAIRLDPNDAYALTQLSWMLATGPGWMRDGMKAVKLANQACTLSQWKIPEFIDTLAAAYAEAGDFDKAVEFEKTALADQAFEQRWGAIVRKRLTLYMQKQPYRDPELDIRPVAPPPRAVKRPPVRG
jgi:tetratricopeptide (TPR) repeat protein